MDTITFHEYTNKTFGPFVSTRHNDIALQSDNLLKCLYISKYYNNDKTIKKKHANRIIKNWKNIFNENVNTVPIETIGKLLKFNISVNAKDRFDKHRKTFTDASLSKTGTGFRPIMLNKINKKGGGSSTESTLMKTTPVGTIKNKRVSVKPMRNVNNNRELIPSLVLKCDHKHKLIIDEHSYETLITSKDLHNVTDAEDKRKLDIIIKAGYYWENPKEQIIESSLDSFYNMKSAKDEQRLYNLVYALHNIDGVVNEVDPIPIVNLRVMQGGSKFPFPILKIKSQMNEIPDIIEDFSNNDKRRHIHFLIFKDPLNPNSYIKVVVKIGNVANDNPYRKEANNYVTFKNNHETLQANKSYVNKQVEKQFYENNLTQFYNSGTVDTDESFRIKLNGKDFSFKFTYVSPEILNAKQNMIFNRSYVNQFYFIVERDDSFLTAEDAIRYLLKQTKNTVTNGRQMQSIINMNGRVLETMSTAMKLHGFYHGDLKPDNIFVSRFNNGIKIFDLDFSGFIYNDTELLKHDKRTIDFQLFKSNIEPITRYKIDIFNFRNKTGSDLTNLSYHLHTHDIWRMFYCILQTMSRCLTDANLNRVFRYYSKKNDMWNTLIEIGKLLNAGSKNNAETWANSSFPLVKITAYLKSSPSSV